jgi:hypothetical protein
MRRLSVDLAGANLLRRDRRRRRKDSRPDARAVGLIQANDILFFDWSWFLFRTFLTALTSKNVGKITWVIRSRAGASKRPAPHNSPELIESSDGINRTEPWQNESTTLKKRSSVY